MTPGELGLWLSWITALGGGLGAFSGGWLADRWVYRQPRARAYVGMIGAILAVPFLIGGFILSDTRLALLCFLPANFFGTLWLGPSGSIVQDLVPPAMRAMASAVFIFIITIIGLSAGPQTIGIMNDLIGTPGAIRHSLLWTAVIMNLVSAVFFWLTAQTMVVDMEAKKRL